VAANPRLARVFVSARDVTLDATPLAVRRYPDGASPEARTAALPPPPRVVARLTDGPIALSCDLIPTEARTTLAVRADRAVPATALLAALEALARGCGTERVELQLGAPSGARAITLDTEVPAVSAASADAPAGDDLRLEVFVRRDGLQLMGSGGTLARGCQTLGAAESVAVPDGANGLDAVALTACVAEIQAQLPNARRVYVTADAGVDVGRLAQALVALLGPASAHRWDRVIPRVGRVPRMLGVPLEELLHTFDNVLMPAS
jgi:hypothetical protein